VRNSFWRGVITGSIIGAAISMIAGDSARERKGILGNSPRQARSGAHRMLRGVSKTVNDLIK